MKQFGVPQVFTKKMVFALVSVSTMESPIIEMSKVSLSRNKTLNTSVS